MEGVCLIFSETIKLFAKVRTIYVPIISIWQFVNFELVS